MKKNIPILLTLFLCIVANAQKFKIKKDKIVLDGVAVAIVEKPERDSFVYKTLDGAEIFSASLEGNSIDSNNIFYWVTIKTPKGELAEVEYEILRTYLSVRKIVTHLLVMKYKLFTNQGIDTEALQQLITNHGGDAISSKYNNKVKEGKELLANLAAQRDQVRNTLNPQLNADGSITMRNFKMQRGIVGRLKDYNNGRDPFKPNIKVTDLDGITVATLTGQPGGSLDYIVNMYNGDSFIYAPNDRYSKGSRQFNHHFVLELAARGYRFEHQAAQELDELHAQKVESAVERSINLYEASGYAIDKNGQKYEGLITIPFELIDVYQTGQRTVEEGNDFLGKRLTIIYKNEKGRKRTKTLSAKNNTSFCVYNTDGSEACYYGVAVKGDALKKLQNISSLGFNNSYYYRSIYKSSEIHLLQDPVELDRYVVKTPKEKKGQMIDRRKNEKLWPKLAEYLKSCKALSKEIKTGAFDLKLEENLIAICEEYTDCQE